MADNKVVGVVTSSRADYGLLKRLLFRIKDSDCMKLNLIVTGTHLLEEFGNTDSEIEEDGFRDFQRIKIDLGDDSKAGMAIATGKATEAFAGYFRDNRPDILVVLGDRFEIFAAASAAFLMGIPIAHISGGDITEGAIDDTVRHCITKMSSIHFPGCEQSANRIIRMGENPATVFNVGEPGVENCLNTPLMTRKELSESIGFDITKDDYAVVTFHPVTRENNTAGAEVYELIKAMDKVPMKYIITLANADSGGREINSIWEQEKKSRDNWLVVSSLGMTRYLSAMKYSKVVLGNSSSGIVEAPSLFVPTVNIGTRQEGRMQAQSVISCECNEKDIKDSIEKSLDAGFVNSIKGYVSPFGTGNTSEQIYERLKEYLNTNHESVKCDFYE